MAERLEVTMLTEKLRESIVALLGVSRRWPGLAFADLRLGIAQGKAAGAENMALRGAGDDYGMSVGVRVIAEHNGIHSPGYDGRPVGAEEFENLLGIIDQMIQKAHERALASAREKSQTKSRYTDLGQSLWDMRLRYPEWPKEPVMIPAEYGEDPVSYPLEAIKNLVRNVASLFKEARGINYSYVGAGTGLSREFYANSFGVSITQDFALSQAMVYAASGDTAIYDVLGHQRGPEIFSRGIDEPYIKFPALDNFTLGISNDVLALAKAPTCPTTEI